MNIINNRVFILCTVFCLSSSVLNAAGALSKVDLYGEPTPKPFTSEGVVYTTPALQGMIINKLSVPDVANIIKSHMTELKSSTLIKDGTLYLNFRNLVDSTKLELIGVWKE